jgi:hypothetical protein
MLKKYQKSYISTHLLQDALCRGINQYFLAVLDDSQCPARNPNDAPISEIPASATFCSHTPVSAGDQFVFECSGSSETFVLTFEQISCSGNCESDGTECSAELSINQTPPNPCLVTAAEDWNGCDPCNEGLCENF